MPTWSSLVLAVALSIDGIGAGVAYGLRHIRIPLASLAIVGLCTGSLMTVSMAAGGFLATLLPLHRANSVGAVILISVGLWQLLLGWRHYLGQYEVSTKDRPLLHVRIPILGVAVQVLRDPAAADVNRSGVIDTRESLLLGLALGLDALGAGFGAAMTGFPFWIVPGVALACMSSVYAGSWMGRWAGSRWSGRRGFALPGLLLILLGLLQF